MNLLGKKNEMECQCKERLQHRTPVLRAPSMKFSAEKQGGATPVRFTAAGAEGAPHAGRASQDGVRLTAHLRACV
uniref:Uncharacterized protein n=1 Tax=Paracidobacterium acidisoli TaxID=2303751 RepID=A0A372ITY5_9BACT